MSLTFNQFEVLQLIVRRQGLSLEQIQAELSTTYNINHKAIISQLVHKGLVRRSNDMVLPKPKALEALEPYRVKRAVILGAGKGERMCPATRNVPKPMVQVHSKRIIETQLDALASAGITDITIVRGYRGEVYDLLLPKYPHIKFIGNSHWDSSEAIVSTHLAIDLLAGAYLIEGDLYIKGQNVIRPYEYHSTYCGIPGEVENDWHFYADRSIGITHLAHGYSNESHGVPHRFVGIMYWKQAEVNKLKKDIVDVVARPNNQHRFVESVPFDKQTNAYTIHARPVQINDVIELDTYQELQDLRVQEQNTLRPATDSIKHSKNT